MVGIHREGKWDVGIVVLKLVCIIFFFFLAPSLRFNLGGVRCNWRFLCAQENNDGSLHDIGVKGLGLMLKKFVWRLLVAVFLDVRP